MPGEIEIALSPPHAARILGIQKYYSSEKLVDKITQFVNVLI